MVDSLPNMTHVVVSYMNHRLRTKFQFPAISKIKNDLNNNPSKVIIVMDHKQNILQIKYHEVLFQIKYHEVQVEYYANKGMIVA